MPASLCRCTRLREEYPSPFPGRSVRHCSLNSQAMDVNWSSTGLSTISAAGTTTYTTIGMVGFRIRASAYVSGTAVVTITAGGSGGGGGSTTGLAPNTGIFTVSNNCSSQTNCLAWTDDNSTDNCGTATTTFMTAINAYAGPGRPQVFIGGSGVGKAYKLTSCSLAFLIPVNITMSATINCAQSSANCIQFGPTGQSGFTAANSPTYGIHGGGTFVGGASLTWRELSASRG